MLARHCAHRFSAKQASRPTAICPWHSPRVRDQRLAISFSARRLRVRRPRRGPTQRPVRPPRHPRTIRRPRGQSRAIYRPTLRPARQLSENRLDHQLSPLRGTQLQALCRRSRSSARRAQGRPPNCRSRIRSRRPSVHAGQGLVQCPWNLLRQLRYNVRLMTRRPLHRSSAIRCWNRRTISSSVASISSRIFPKSSISGPPDILHLLQISIFYSISV